MLAKLQTNKKKVKKTRAWAKNKRSIDVTSIAKKKLYLSLINSFSYCFYFSSHIIFWIERKGRTGKTAGSQLNMLDQISNNMSLSKSDVIISCSELGESSLER